MIIVIVVLALTAIAGWALWSMERSKRVQAEQRITALLSEKKSETLVAEAPAFKDTLEADEAEEEPDFTLPPSIEPLKPQLCAIIDQEVKLTYGARDILGDDWLRLRRIATRFKRLNPSLDTHEIFEAILTLYREMGYVSGQRILDVDVERSDSADSLRQ